MKSIDPLLNRRYDTRQYHCVHFVIDAAKYLFERDYSNSFIGLTGAVDSALNTSRQTMLKNKRLKKPINGCIVLMTSLMNQSHVGLFYCGRVLHLTESGVYFQEIRSLKHHYFRFRYYEATHLSE